MSNKEYCTNKDIDCNQCSLANYGRDCHNQPIRTKAQKAADKRYAEKVAGRHKVISFIFSVAEAAEIESIIKSSGLSKVDFLRKAVKAHQDGKF